MKKKEEKKFNEGYGSHLARSVLTGLKINSYNQKII